MDAIVQPLPHTTDRGETTTKNLLLAYLSCWFGYMFDVTDYLLYFYIGRQAVTELRGTEYLVEYNIYIFAVKLFGWGVGGFFCGWLADRLGRKAVLTGTIAGYSLFTALSGVLPTYFESYWTLFALQGLAAVCVSGEWLSSMAIIAEMLHGKTKVYAGVGVQLAFAAGALLASLANLWIGAVYGWQALMIFGAVPALFLLVVRYFGLKDPQLWIDEKNSGRKRGSLKELFSPQFRSRVIVNFIIVTSFLVGWYGGNNMLFPLIGRYVTQAGGTPSEVLTMTSTFFNTVFYCSFAMYVMLALSGAEIGRKARPLYILFAGMSLGTSLWLFLHITNMQGLIDIAPFYGCTVIAGFGIFGIFLPQAFPTRLRGLALGVTYNGGRLVTAAFLMLQSTLVGWLGIAYVGAVAALAYLLPIIVVYCLPEDAPEE